MSASENGVNSRSQPIAVLRRLPGKAKTRKDALQEYQELNAERRSRIPAALWPFWAPDPDAFYRWRVQLDCGCVSEVLSWDDKSLPVESRWTDPASGKRLPAGQKLCRHDDSLPAPYRDITEWGERREVYLPADPVDPPRGEDPEVWEKLRHGEPHASAFWTVNLSCGHVTEVATDLSWKPEDGSRRTSAKRQQEMTEDFEKFWAADPDGQEEREREHTRRMLADGWPLPQPEELCYTCPEARFIIAYQRTGWLVPRKPESPSPKPPSRASLERRLHQAEDESRRLRNELAQLDEQEPPKAATAEERQPRTRVLADRGNDRENN